MIQCSSYFSFYVSHQHVFKVLFLDLLALLSFWLIHHHALLVIWPENAAVSLGCLEVMCQNHVLKLLQSTLSDQLIFFVHLNLTLLQPAYLILQYLILSPLIWKQLLPLIEFSLQFISLDQQWFYLLPQRQKLVPLIHQFLLLFLFLGAKLLCYFFLANVVQMMLELELLFACLWKLIILLLYIFWELCDLIWKVFIWFFVCLNFL